MTRSLPLETRPRLPHTGDMLPLEPRATPRLVLVVDTEEEFDWYAPFERARRGVEHMRSIERLQSVCDEVQLRPTYVVDHPIATQATSVKALSAIIASGRCEIGAHLHPWVSPPFTEELTQRNSYPGNLPREIERDKLGTLTAAIEAHLGTRPRAYKAGRYGFGPNTAEILEELEYEIDLSPCPPFDFSADGGPDWSSHPARPYWIGARRSILALPNSGAYVGFLKPRAHAFHGFVQRPLARALRLPGVLARLGALERLFLSPEGFRARDLERLTLALQRRGVTTFQLSLHSPSIEPGHTPYTRSEADVAALLATLAEYLRFFRDELGGSFATPTEIRARAARPTSP